MIKFLKKLFEKKPAIIMNDPDFGEIIFVSVKSDPSKNYWEMNNPITFSEGTINFMAIPGNEDGPHQYAREIIFEKCSKLNELWLLCQDEIEKQIDCWYPDKKDLPVKSIFDLVGFNVDNEQEWEVSFEAKQEFKWVYLSYQFNGNELVSGEVDT